MCAHPAGWQKLANRIHAPVYCPGWLPDPLIGQIGGTWNNINSVSTDRSYLESFVWQETGGGAAGGELHVNLRGYPGVTKIPTCRTGGVDSRNVPCFDAPNGTVTAERDHGPPCTPSTRTPTCGTSRSSGAGTAASTRCPSTSRRRSPTTTSCAT